MHQNIIWIYLVLLGLIEIIDFAFFTINKKIYVSPYNFVIVQQGYDIFQVILTILLGYFAIDANKKNNKKDYSFVKVIRYLDLGISFCIFALMGYVNYHVWK